jgi:hypothetical protein
MYERLRSEMFAVITSNRGYVGCTVSSVWDLVNEVGTDGECEERGCGIQRCFYTNILST